MALPPPPRVGVKRQKLEPPLAEGSLPPSFYGVPPPGEVTLEEMERAARVRIRTLSDQQQPAGFDAEMEASPKWDRVSHAVLSLALARAGTDDVRSLWAEAESKLFRRRFRECSDPVAIATVARESAVPMGFARRIPPDETRFDEYGFPLPRSERPPFELIPCDGDDLETYASVGDLWCRRDDSATCPSNQNSRPILAVPFECALPLIRHRANTARVWGGLAFVQREAWDDVFTARFLTSLDEVGTILRRGLPTLLLEEADRLVPMFGRLSREVMASVVSVTHGSHHEIFCAQAEPIPRLMLSTVDAEAAHFPPCMHQLHATLRTGHRLKHHYRVVYTLYLKGLGLSVGDQLSLWEAEHRKVPAQVKPWKKYNYNIRHLYGLEGARIDRKPHSCARIIADHPTICPFATYDPSALESVMSRLRVEATDVDIIKSLSAAKQSRTACGALLTATFGGQSRKARLLSVGSPADYYGASRSSIGRGHPEQVTALDNAVVTSSPCSSDDSAG